MKENLLYQRGDLRYEWCFFGRVLSWFLNHYIKDIMGFSSA